MIIQRVSFVGLALVAIFFGVNLVSAAARYIDVNQTYDAIRINLVGFDYAGPREIVVVSLEVVNPSGNDIDVIAIDLRYSANSHFVGGGDTRPNLVVEAGTSEIVQVDANINDIQYMERLNPDMPIEWLVLARLQTSIDPDLDPIRIQFSFRTETN